MHPFAMSAPTLAISAIYCLYEFYLRDRERRKQRTLRERVTYMLWVMAQRMDSAAPAA